MINEAQFYMKIDLMFMEALEQEIKNPSQIKQPMSDDKIKKFQSISSRVYKLNKILKGINEYYPITFDTLHFSSMTISLHSVIMGNK